MRFGLSRYIMLELLRLLHYFASIASVIWVRVLRFKVTRVMTIKADT